MLTSETKTNKTTLVNNLVALFLIFIGTFNVGFGQTDIIPTRSDVSGIGSWSDTDITGTTYLQLLKSTSTTISQNMDFTSYSSVELNFKARKYGGPDVSQSTITVSISTDNSSWTVLGTRVPANTSLVAMSTFDLSSYTGTQIRLKIQSLGASSNKGVGINDIAITGTPIIGGKIVTFNANGGSGTMTPQNASSTTNLTTNAFTRAGYTFAGWNTLASGTGTAYADGGSYPFTADETLYAQWTVYVGPCHLENMSSIGTTTSYDTRTWSGTGGTWTATNAREDQTINGKAITIQNGTLTSPTFSDGIGDITVTTQLKFSGSAGNLIVKVNGTTVGTIPYSSTVQTTTISGINIGGNIIITIENSSVRVAIDDVNWTCYTAGPTLITTPSSLIALNYTVGSGPSTVQTFELTGTNLDGSDVELLTGIDFEISTDNIAYSDFITLPSFNGTATPIYVRLKAGLTVGSYTDLILIAGGGVLSSNEPEVTLSGEVLAVITPVITSTLTQSVEYGSAVTYQITADNTPTSFNATPLPLGLSINTSTGEITGNISHDVGTINTIISAINSGGTDTETLTWTITKKLLTVTGLSGTNKIYDGNTTANISGTGILTGIVFSDVVTLSGAPSATFSDKNAATGKTITITGYTLSGAKAGNYSLTQATETADITKKELTVSGATATNKIYDGNTTATISGGTLNGIISPDLVSVSGGGTFNTSDVGTSKPVTATLTLSGTGSGNYTITQPSGLTANITKANPVFTTSTITLNVGATYVLPGANVSSTSPGTITYSISSGGNATLAGITISGVTVGTETLTVTQAASTNYNAGSTTVTVNVNDVANGTYRTTSAGTWPSGTATWERYNGGSWSSATPSASSTDLLIIRHTVNTSGAFSASGGVGTKMIIENGGTFIAAHNCTFVSLLVKSLGVFSINDPAVWISSGGTITVESNGKLISNSATFNITDKFWQGTENFKEGSIFEIIDWDWDAPGNGESLIDSDHEITVNIAGYYFGNLVVSGTPTGKAFTLVAKIGTHKLCENNLIINNGSPSLSVILTNKKADVEIGGSLVINSNKFSFAALTSTDAVHTIKGNILLNAGTIDFNQTKSSAGIVRVNIQGDLIGISGSILNTDNKNDCSLHFTNTSTIQNIDVNPVVVIKNVSMFVDSGSETQLLNNNLKLTEISSLHILSEGTFNFNWSATTPLFVSDGGLNTTEFHSFPSSILKITSENGIAKVSAGLKGNVRTSTRIFDDLGDFHYIGKVSQKTGNGLPTPIRNLYINNSGLVGDNLVTLTNYQKIVHNELTMTKGHVVSTVDSMLILGASTTELGTLNYNSGYVLGHMRRWFNGTNSGNATGLYPMGFEDLVVGAGTGVKNRHTKIEFSDAPADGGHLTVQYIGTPMGPDGIPILAVNSGGADFDVITTEDQGYWKFDNESGKLINAAYTISCTGEGYQVITDLNKLTLLKRVVANGPNWFCPGVHIATSGSITMPTVSRSGVSNWSNFGFGGGTGNPLPVELTAFQVSCDEDQIQIQWSTASELNSSHFEVEKSNDLINWNLISETAAAGNSNINMDYQTSDIERSSDVIYYRLKQVDLNGESKVYGPISTLCEIESNSMKVYPNPTQGEYQVEINWTETSTNAQLQLLDLTGKVIHEMDLNLNTGTTHLQFNQENLQMGTYLIRLQDSKSELNPIRLVITK